MHAPNSQSAVDRRWSHDVVEETLGEDARRLTVDISARLMASWWDRYAQVVGVPARRWRSLRPTNDGPLLAIVGGRPAFDLQAWTRFASLAAGAVALPASTAAAFGLDPSQLEPPAPRPGRLVDLLRSRRASRRLRRSLRTIDADFARFSNTLRRDLIAQALADGEDDTPFAQLPPYALAARLERLLQRAGERWTTPCVLDHASGAAVDRLLGELQRDPSIEAAQLDRELALRTSGGGVAIPDHVAELQELARADDPAAGLDGWLDRWGWLAMRGIPLEATPFREQRAGMEQWLRTLVVDARGESVDRPSVDVPDQPQVHADEASVEARRLVALREHLGHERAQLHAALRAIVWTLGDQLVRAGAVGVADEVFDLELPRLLALARGVAGTPGPRNRAERRERPPATAASGRRIEASEVTAQRLEVGESLRGHAAGAGRITARAEVVLTADPPLDLAAGGAILVCRHTDPGWMPLLLRCAGVVTERGGPLSHAAIVARELGIPVATGVAGVTTRITGAMLLDLDGATGVVTRVR